MRSGARLCLALLACGALIVTATLAVGAVVLRSQGTLQVQVHEKTPGGSDVSVTLPGVLVRTAIEIAPERLFEELQGEARAWLPVIRAACESLERSPDGVFLEVRGPDANVTVRKTGTVLRIEVDSPEENVLLDVPLRLIRRAAERLDSAAGIRRA